MRESGGLWRFWRHSWNDTVSIPAMSEDRKAELQEAFMAGWKRGLELLEEEAYAEDEARNVAMTPNFA